MKDALKLLLFSPTKGLFPIQDTRSLDNTHRDLKATQWGRDRSTKQASYPSPCKTSRRPNSLQIVSAGCICTSRNKYIHMQTHTHAHKIPSTDLREVGVCFCGLTVGIMTSSCPPPTSLFSHSRVI